MFPYTRFGRYYKNSLYSILAEFLSNLSRKNENANHLFEYFALRFMGNYIPMIQNQLFVLFACS